MSSSSRTTVSSLPIWVGPLKAGEYGFFGEFNEDTAQGKLIVE
jgi:hypothetical protein